MKYLGGFWKGMLAALSIPSPSIRFVFTYQPASAAGPTALRGYPVIRMPVEAMCLAGVDSRWPDASQRIYSCRNWL